MKERSREQESGRGCANTGGARGLAGGDGLCEACAIERSLFRRDERPRTFRRDSTVESPRR
jgi:hypothetical protein